MSGFTRLVAAGSVGAAALSAHAVLNWRLLRKTPVLPSPTGVRPHVAVLIPARDEADRIGPTLASVLEQRGVDMHVYVLDDGSTDGTAAVCRAVADDDPRVEIIRGRPPPAGWLGKPHACWQLAERALQLPHAEVLVFLDADVVLDRDALAAVVDMLEQGQMHLLSPYPRQEISGLTERLVQPLLQWSWITFLPLRLAERLPHESLTAGNGQLMACRADAYRTAGGHARVRDQVIEDMALARSFKAAGLRVGLADGTNLASCRMYEGWAELREGYSKSLWAAFGSRAGAIVALLLLSLLYLLPPIGMLLGALLRRRRLAAAGAAGYGAAVAGRAFVAAKTGGRPADALGHPASVAVLAWLLRESWRRKDIGALSWKGRPIP